MERVEGKSDNSKIRGEIISSKEVERVEGKSDNSKIRGEIISSK